ncbi:MAG: rRNA maturation RNase YbeY [Armatimonadota bacterium]|nr:rRNA maturation RNase YbeY [Armatimonadota bacterium]
MNQERLKKVVAKSLQVEGFNRPAEVSIVLTDDEMIRELNKEYRGVDSPTDVLAFSQLEDKEVTYENDQVVLGDIIISVETAEKQAREHGHSLDDEISLLVAHGMLHLLGYGDQTEAQAAVMREHEKEILEQSNDGRSN